MAVNKNFVVKNGLEVATDVILANATSKNVGIGSTQPTFTLDVRGGIGATDLQVTGFTTVAKDLQVGTSGSVFYVSAVSYTHLRAHETCADLVCRLLLEKKKKN